MGSELHRGPVGNWKTSEGSKCQVLVEEGWELGCGDLYVTWCGYICSQSDRGLACSPNWNTRVIYDKATV